VKPRLLDLFCGAGGAAKGYADAGFDVVGVDILPQPHYPFPFVLDDALEYVAAHDSFGRKFDAIHASPPCQAYSMLTASWRTNKGREYPDLIAPTRTLLEATGLPYVIENVIGAPLFDPILLCGSMFPGLGVRRHRLFETNWPLIAPECQHAAMPRRYAVMRHGRTYMSAFAPVYGSGGGKAMAEWADAMGIDWMRHAEMAEAIPPAYTQFIGEELLRQVTSTASTMVSD
jgi:DNA (cytosine-5)-methyltransferase 1